MRIAVLLSVLALLSRAPAQSAASSRAESLPTSAALAAQLEKVCEKNKVPAVGCAATTGDRLLAIGVAGVRKNGSPERASVNDRWHLGSCTKSMTATLLARLADRGVLRFETTIGDVFKNDGGDWGDMKPDWAPVTIEQLLAHRGGVPSDLSAGGLWGRLWARKGTPTEQRRELFEGVVSRAPESQPGTRYLYSNAGIAIAGFMAERLTGKAWEDLMREELFAPLGMTASGFGAPGKPGAIDEPWGHSAEGKPVEPGPNADNPPAIGPAGTVNASLADWAKYAALHLRGSNGRSDYLKPETFARIQKRPAAGDYAFGWAHGDRPWANGHVLTHSGSNTMWFCAIWVAPDRDVAFLGVCNAGGEAAARAADEAIGAAIGAVKDQLPPLRR